MKASKKSEVKMENSDKKRKASQDIDDQEKKTLKKVHNEGDLHAVNKWWEKDESEDDQKWMNLEHHGVLFPALYQKHNVKPIYNSQPIELNA